MHYDRIAGKNYLRSLYLLLAVICPVEALFCQSIHKRYPISHGDKYWFHLQGDLYFSEEVTLPGYTAEQLGKLEYPTVAVDSKHNVYIAHNYTLPDGRETIYLNTFNDADIKHDVFIGETSRRYLKLAKEPSWKESIQISSVHGVEYRSRIAVTNDDVVWIVWSAKRK